MPPENKIELRCTSISSVGNVIKKSKTSNESYQETSPDPIPDIGPIMPGWCFNFLVWFIRHFQFLQTQVYHEKYFQDQGELRVG